MSSFTILDWFTNVKQSLSGREHLPEAGLLTQLYFTFHIVKTSLSNIPNTDKTMCFPLMNNTRQLVWFAGPDAVDRIKANETTGDAASLH